MIRQLGMAQRVGTRLPADVDAVSTFPTPAGGVRPALRAARRHLSAPPFSRAPHYTAPTLTDPSGETQP